MPAMVAVNHWLSRKLFLKTKTLLLIIDGNLTLILGQTCKFTYISFQFNNIKLIYCFIFSCSEGVDSMSTTNVISTSKIKNSLPLVVLSSKLDYNTCIKPNLPDVDEENQLESLNHGDFAARG